MLSPLAVAFHLTFLVSAILSQDVTTQASSNVTWEREDYCCRGWNLCLDYCHSKGCYIGWCWSYQHNCQYGCHCSECVKAEDEGETHHGSTNSVKFGMTLVLAVSFFVF
ncbi:hypothetical protein L596_028596 [Steinernema carpocapsae]|uniref:Chitin-binding type-1 domain-containing protein n=1 Tax=Steinernema carpocapsae TaxID=34508 RepID=A0A4U5LZ00_STECR|nr:hypothetical protein L596_028596 [Steinernema carpocapsae]